MATALSKALHHSGDLIRQINVEKERLALLGLFLKGRQILFRMYQHFRISEAEGSVLDFQDLMQVRMKNDDLRTFLTDWEMVLTGMARIPDEDILEAMFKSQVQRHPGLREHMAYYDRLHIGHVDRSYGALVAAVRQYLEARRRNKTREEMSRSMGGGRALVVTNARSQDKTSRKKGSCYQWTKMGKCARGERCPYAHDANSRGDGRGATLARRGVSNRGSSSRGASSSSRSSSAARSSSPSPKKVCKFFLRGPCKHGDKCQISI